MLDDDDWFLACLALEVAESQDIEVRRHVAEYTAAKTIEMLGKALKG